MNLSLRRFALGTLLVFALPACTAAAAELTEAEINDAMLYARNHPPGETIKGPVTIKFFKEEACDDPTPQVYRCAFDVTVTSANIGASMYNNVPFGFFYEDKSSGKCVMRPPF